MASFELAVPGGAQGLERDGGRRIPGVGAGPAGNRTGLTPWDETRDGFIRQIGLRTGQPPDIAEPYVPALPTTLLDRALWVNQSRGWKARSPE